MPPNPTVPNLKRFLPCYLFVCFAFYFYFRYYLTDEKEYARPRPAALTHENKYRPLNKLSSKQVAEMSYKAPKLEEFRREWLRQRHARVDWQSMLRPCVDNMAWGQTKQDWGKANRSSAITSDVIFWDIRPAGEFSKILIHSKTADNRTKTIGGDTWRVYLRGKASIAANVFDHNNGTYEALFLVTEPGVYQLEIHLDYSLCDGFRDPPRDWFIVGNAQGKHQKEGSLGTLDDYLYQPLRQRDSITVAVPAPQFNMPLQGKLSGLKACSSTCKHMWDGFGQWVMGEWRPYLKASGALQYVRHVSHVQGGL